MAKVKRLHIASTIEEEAMAWVARCDAGPLDPVDAAEFNAWLAASPVHAAAYDRYAELWSELDGLSSSAVHRSKATVANDRERGWISHRAVAAAVAVLLVTAATITGLGIAADPTYETTVGEQRMVLLPDGSRVTLNTDTRLTVNFEAERRLISLERGEALFEVAHDRSRPFIVDSEAGTVRAVGTRFVVRIRRDHALAVVVTEGKVLVASGDGVGPAREPGKPTPLVAGQEMRAEGSRIAVASLAPEDLGRELAWREGDIIFAGEPLGEAAAEMQRYTSTTIKVDPAVAGYSLGGYFRTNDVEAFLETVERVFPVRAVRSGNEVRLVPRSG